MSHRESNHRTPLRSVTFILFSTFEEMIKLEAAKFPIKTAVVFEDQAQVSRLIDFGKISTKQGQLQAGLNEIILQGLPLKLIKDSVRRGLRLGAIITRR